MGPGTGPAITGIWCRITASTSATFFAACTAEVFPEVVVTPMISTSGRLTSTARARASSTPQSVSMKIRTQAGYARNADTGL